MIGSLGALPESVVDVENSLRGASQEPRVLSQEPEEIRLRHDAALEDDANLQCENPQAATASKLRSHITSITAKTELRGGWRRQRFGTIVQRWRIAPSYIAHRTSHPRTQEQDLFIFFTPTNNQRTD